eukprot:944790_1
MPIYQGKNESQANYLMIISTISNQIPSKKRKKTSTKNANQFKTRRISKKEKQKQQTFKARATRDRKTVLTQKEKIKAMDNQLKAHKKQKSMDWIQNESALLRFIHNLTEYVQNLPDKITLVGGKILKALDKLFGVLSLAI